MGALRDWWSSLSVADKRYLGAGALGLAGVGVYGIALARKASIEDQAVSQAVSQAVEQLGPDTDPNDSADIAYWALYPECPEWLDPEMPEHSLCIDLWLSVRDEARFQLGCARDRPALQVYPPGSERQVQLFRQAAVLVGVPKSWASDPGLRFVIAHESSGVVGIPNYTYGWKAKEAACWPRIHQELRDGVVSARSSASGLGQLLLSNVDTFYPNGRAGIGDPLQEAAGMLAYIKKRYGTPEWARRCYGKGTKESPCIIPGKPDKTFTEGY